MGRRGIGAMVLAAALLAVPGCFHPVRTTYRATRFVGKTGSTLLRAGARVVTWPVRVLADGGSVRGRRLATEPIADGPEPVIQGAVDPGD